VAREQIGFSGWSEAPAVEVGAHKVESLWGSGTGWRGGQPLGARMGARRSVVDPLGVIFKWSEVEDDSGGVDEKRNPPLETPSEPLKNL